MEQNAVDQSHPALADEVERLYCECISALGEANSWLNTPRGPGLMVYKNLQDPFYELFLHTKFITEISSRLENTEEIEDWMEQKYTPTNLKAGIRLCVNYIQLLLNAKIISYDKGRK